MGSPLRSSDDLPTIREKCRQLDARIEKTVSTQNKLIASLQSRFPDLASRLNSSAMVVSAFNGRKFTPLSLSDAHHSPNSKRNPDEVGSSITENRSRRRRIEQDPTISTRSSQEKKSVHCGGTMTPSHAESEGKFTMDDSGSPLSVVRSMVAVCLLERVPFSPVDSSTVLRKLESDQSASVAEKSALREVGGESGTILAVEMALRSMAEDNGGVELEEFVISGKSRVMVLGIDRSRLIKELPAGSQYHHHHNNHHYHQLESASVVSFLADSNQADGGFGFGSAVHRSVHEMWPGHGPPRMAPGAFPRATSMVGLPQGMGIPPLNRPPPPLASSVGVPQRPSTEEEDMKDLEVLLNKKTYMEMQKSKAGEELLDLIHRPTAKEAAVAAKFKTKGGSQLKEYCTALTREDCGRRSGSFTACEKVHFRRIISAHTDTNLGDCSFLDTCRHMKTCKYVHYELDMTGDMAGGPAMAPSAGGGALRAEYCSEVELGEPQWVNCDIRTFRMDILGKFGVIMADPPWDIHMELPYGTMADDEMRTLNVPALQTDGLIFLWVTGRAMELGRECLELWGYHRVAEIIWVKTNQLQRIIRTGRTGHWLNHSKEHCLVGIKGNPDVNRNIDTDVIVAEVRETSRKPDEMYPMLERISPRTRKLELFARMHNTHAGWLSLGNQLQGVRLVDEGMRGRFKAAYPDVEVQSPQPDNNPPVFLPP